MTARLKLRRGFKREKTAAVSSQDDHLSFPSTIQDPVSEPNRPVVNSGVARQCSSPKAPYTHGRRKQGSQLTIALYTALLVVHEIRVTACPTWAIPQLDESIEGWAGDVGFGRR